MEWYSFTSPFELTSWILWYIFYAANPTQSNQFHQPPALCSKMIQKNLLLTVFARKMLGPSPAHFNVGPTMLPQLLVLVALICVWSWENSFSKLKGIYVLLTTSYVFRIKFAECEIVKDTTILYNCQQEGIEIH